jgi:MFS family permease
MSGTSVAAWTMGSRRWLALILLCAVQFMVVLVLSSVSIALPSVEEDLGFSEKCLQWVVSGYALTFGGFCCSRGRWPSSTVAATSARRLRRSGKIRRRTTLTWL